MLPQQVLSIVLAIYIGIILNMPVYLRNLGSSTHDYLEMLASVTGITAFTALLLLILSLAGHRIFRAGAIAMVVLSSAAAYYMTFFHVVIGYGIIVSVLTTDMDMSKEQVGFGFMAWLLVTGILPAIAIWRSRFRYSRNPVTLKQGYAITALHTVLLASTCALLASQMFHLVDDIAREEAAKNNTYAPSPSGMLAHAYLPANWLTATALFVWEKGFGEKNQADLFNPYQEFHYRETESLDDVYVVVIIGETTRADHMGILGYHRDTTPLLAKEKNLFAFRGVSCDTSTKLSLRCMFVRENGASNNEQRTVLEQNIFAVLSQLGFTSELFAMQSEMWFYNSVKADSYKFREILSAEQAHTGKPLDDMVLVNELSQSVARHPQGKHLVILHTKGSHFQYSERYPREFARFKPECHTIDDRCTMQETINSFDNSVLYVDTMLHKTIDALRKRKALVIYAGDHGESITEDKRFHGTPRHLASAEEFRVPILVWASDAYLESSAARQQSFARLQELEERQSIIPHNVLYDSILGCLGYESKNGGIKSKNNLCHDDYRSSHIAYPSGGAYPEVRTSQYLADNQ